ncbi:hypothetical protein G7043_20370 [Lentzea sp. NEAU-D13]|uniref:Uncharacterized protein n=1 Tax=Lentzea alba TaxID=2714351 RepID=A0A7C9RRV6_9PSEU|nr:hypothetical protein [Lentzea alba]NGY61284.1 hypothetical protein [Lentzea alba]
MTDPTPRGQTGVPRWVKVSAAIVLLLLLAVVVLHLAGNSFGGHTP